MRIAIGNDHTSIDLKKAVISHLTQRGIAYEDFGPITTESCHYPIFGEKVANVVASGEYDSGILLCGTGIGMCISANKVNGIRAAVCSEPYSAMLTKQHNNANILCLGARIVAPEYAAMIIDAWIDAEFMGDKHQTRIDMFCDIENKNRI